MQDTAIDGHPNDPPIIPVATRYAAGEVLGRLGWLPPDLDTWVEVQVSSSRIITVGRYPVTNVQFDRFIAAGSYENPAYWGGGNSKGWRWRVKAHPGYRRQGPVTQPEYWDHPRLGQAHRGYPVVGVSWYEAMAYCRWLEERLQMADCRFHVWRAGELETLNLPPETLSVRLPAEGEWVAAAGGLEDGRYPWGPEWHASRANTREGGVGGTTPVAMYPSGQSPGGIWDMGGNVWEWTMSADDDAQRRSILRCGSWLDVHRLARVAVRGWYFPAQSYHYVGFRVVVSLVEGVQSGNLELESG
jgi:formylglycine-generating enzyme required for sulfatase activity